MIAACDVLLALWNGTPGGTKNAVREAEICEVETLNLWKDWEDYYKGIMRSNASVRV